MPARSKDHDHDHDHDIRLGGDLSALVELLQSEVTRLRDEVDRQRVAGAVLESRVERNEKLLTRSEDRLIGLLETAVGGNRRAARLADRERDRTLDERLCATLKLVRDQGAAGTPAADLVGPLGIEGVRGVGPRMGRFRRRLSDLGFDAADVVVHQSMGSNQARWFPGPLIGDAITRLSHPGE